MRTDKRTDGQTDRQTFQLSYQNKSILECQQDVKASVRQEGRYTERRADSVTERQNDSMADSRAAKEPALVLLQYIQNCSQPLHRPKNTLSTSQIFIFSCSERFRL